LAAVFSISGGTEETRAALASRLVPCRPMQRATSPPLVEKPDQDRVLQVERLDQLRQIVGVRVHLVAVPRLARAAMAAPVVGDDAAAGGRRVQHLGLPAVRSERPAVAQDDGPAGAPVLVVDLGAVFVVIVVMACIPRFWPPGGGFGVRSLRPRRGD
jgi:hypothetical protein